MPNLTRKQHVLPFLEEETEENIEPPDEKNNQNESKNCSFKVLSKIGQGGYGEVYVVEKNEGIDKNAIYAMKVRF